MTPQPRNAQRQRRKHWVGALVAFGVGTGFLLALAGRFPLPEISVRWTTPALETESYRPGVNRAVGEQLVLVYIGSSRCRWSNGPELPNVIGSLKTALHDQAQTAGMGFAAVGIARDATAADGIAHLTKFGDFDEVMSGHGWANTGVQRYIYGAMPGIGATPQVLVVARTLDYRLGHVSVVDERTLVRKVGTDEIIAWAGAGANVPL